MYLAYYIPTQQKKRNGCLPKVFAHEFREEFCGRGYSLLVSPTVVAELSFFAELEELPEFELACLALGNMGKWRCQPFTLTPIEFSIAVRFAARLIDQSLIPE